MNILKRNFLALSCALMTLAAIPSPGIAQTRLLDFNDRLVDPKIWEGRSTNTSLEVSRLVRGGRLSLEMKAVGRLDSSTDRVGSGEGVKLKDKFGRRVSFIEGRVRLANVADRGCPSNSDETRAQIRIIGNFLADRTNPGGTTTDDTGKVKAFIALTAGPADVDLNQYRATFWAGLCRDAECDASDNIALGEIGTFSMGSYTRISIGHDIGRRQLSFRANSSTETVDYSAVVPAPIRLANPGIQVQLDAKTPNCVIAPGQRPFVHSTGDIDWVRVNESAFN